VAQRDEERLRLRATSVTSGTAVTTLTGGQPHRSRRKKDDHGNATLVHTEDGTSGPGRRPPRRPRGRGLDPDARRATHSGRTILLDTAAGSTVTLPTSTGNGAVYRFLIKTKATSNSHIVKVGNSTDIIQGIVHTMSDDPATMKGFAAGGTDDTITLNRTTTGSVNVGEYWRSRTTRRASSRCGASPPRPAPRRRSAPV
jgi:hypothetical protein